MPEYVFYADDHDGKPVQEPHYCPACNALWRLPRLRHIHIPPCYERWD